MTTDEKPEFEPRTFAEEGQVALALLDHTLNLSPTPLAPFKQAVSHVIKAVVRLRDHLIRTIEEAEPPHALQRQRVALEQVNQALSLLYGVENPIGEIPRERLQEARAIIADLLDRALFTRS